MNIDVCLSPALYAAYHDPEAVVVVVDVFRATTTMATAFRNGARAIRPVETVEEAQSYKERGWLVGAERNVKRCDFADFGNSPFDYTPERVCEREIAFTTTNGTKAISIAQTAYRVVTGAFVNLGAVADYCLRHQRDVVVLCAGWNDKVSAEDSLFGGALVHHLLQTGAFQPASDAARIACELWTIHKDNPLSYLNGTDHMARLVQHGLADSVPYCLTTNSISLVPELSIQEGSLVLQCIHLNTDETDGTD